MSIKYKIVYLPVAERDLSEIFKYINRDSPSAALSLLDKIDEHISRLADFPQLGKTPQDNRLQKLGYKIFIDLPIIHYQLFPYVLICGKAPDEKIGASIIHSGSIMDFKSKKHQL